MENSAATEVEFKSWGKIPRKSPFKATITEKMDGTNACVIIQSGEIVGVQSRKRMITVEDDNFGFAAWVEDHGAELLALGEGYHYGEWVGPGIQKNPHCLPEKTLFLFNTYRWNSNNPNLPSCCKVVPVLFQGSLKAETIQESLADLQQNAGDGETPEGVIVYYPSFGKYTKHTIKSENGKWCKD